MLETFDYQLNQSDLRYLDNLLYTIKLSEDLSAKIIPLQGNPKEESNFYKVSYKIQNLLILSGEKEAPKAIASPKKSCTKSKPRRTKSGQKWQAL
jgi:hypothetical protein